MRFGQIIEAGLNKIYTEDFEAQKFLLKTTYEQVRDSYNYDILLRAGAFLVPDETYMIKYFGEEIMAPEFDCYNYQGNCVWQNFIVFPVRDVAKRIVGFAGFDPITKLAKKVDAESELADSNHYRYSTKSVFERSHYVYFIEDMFEKAIRDGYVVVTDGMFDTLNLVDNGINSWGLMGSLVSDEIIFYLKFVEHVFVAEDNDRAGRDLFNAISKVHRGAKYIRQNLFKDSDEAILSTHSEAYLNGVRKAISEKSSLMLKFKP
jgi:hypothetical protein